MRVRHCYGHDTIIIVIAVFERDYASIGKPVIIVGGMADYNGRDAWTKNKFVRSWYGDGD